MIRCWALVCCLVLADGMGLPRRSAEREGGVHAQPPAPQLTGPVNDFATIIDPESRSQLEQRINSLMSASGDVVVVVTVPNIHGFADINEFKVKTFENNGRGIGQKGKDNGLLIAVAVEERKVGVEVGYDLEQFITDGFAGQIIRERIAPQFRDGRYGPGLVSGTTAIISRIAAGRGVQLQDVPREVVPVRRRSEGIPVWLIVVLFIILMNMTRGRRRRRRRYWGTPFGWSSGVGPFGGGFGTGFGGGFGGFGGGGGGGGFGGFGGGRSGGGGASGGW